MAQQLRVLQETQVSSPAPTWQLTITSSVTLVTFPGLRVPDRHTPCTDIHASKKKKECIHYRFRVLPSVPAHGGEKGLEDWCSAWRERAASVCFRDLCRWAGAILKDLNSYCGHGGCVL